MIRIFSHYIPVNLALLVVLEALVLMVSVYAGHAIQRSGYGAIAGFDAGLRPPAAVITAGMVGIMTGMGLYQLDLWKAEHTFQIRLIVALFLGVTLTFIVGRLDPSLQWGPTGLAVTLAVALAGSGLLRYCFYRWDKSLTFKPRLLVLGAGSRVARLAELARNNRDHVIVAYVALPSGPSQIGLLPNVITLAPGESLSDLAERLRIQQIVVGIRDRRGTLPVRELLECRLRGIKVTELSTFFEREYRQLLLESLNTSWMLFGDGFRHGWLRSAVKRAFDLTVSAALLVVALPILLVAALCILFETGRPVLYRQERVGEGGRVFTIYKLRTMKRGAENDGSPRWAAANDNRITRTGQVLRRLRIDELPQIVNVFKGDMSFVGPRPERPFFVDKLVKQVPYYSLRHSVKPGITGWAQIRYSYGASLDDVVEKLQYDLYYVKNHTLFLDLVILLGTIEVVLWRKGAR